MSKAPLRPSGSQVLGATSCVTFVTSRAVGPRGASKQMPPLSFPFVSQIDSAPTCARPEEDEEEKIR
eukprot:9024410-Pyramimonas_sp.AAC.1